MISTGSRLYRTRLAALLLVACSLHAAAPLAPAIGINGEGPDNVTGVYDRFLVGTYPAAPVANPNFIGAAFDLSGVGWLSTDSTHCFTLVSPQYLVAATHYLPGIGSTLQFFGTDQQLHTATVDTYRAVTYTGTGGAQSPDLTLVRLTAALPAAVTPVPLLYLGNTDIATPSSFDPYLGVSLFNYGRTARMGTNTLDSIEEFTFASGPSTNIGLVYDLDAGPGETLLEGGDSGSPTFALAHGTFGLLGTHSGVDTAQALSVDAFVSYTSYVQQMQAILATDQQTLILVPEPGALGLLLAGGSLAGGRRWRKVRR